MNENIRLEALRWTGASQTYQRLLQRPTQKPQTRTRIKTRQPMNSVSTSAYFVYFIFFKEENSGACNVYCVALEWKKISLQVPSANVSRKCHLSLSLLRQKTDKAHLYNLRNTLCIIRQCTLLVFRRCWRVQVRSRTLEASSTCVQLSWYVSCIGFSVSVLWSSSTCAIWCVMFFGLWSSCFKLVVIYLCYHLRCCWRTSRFSLCITVTFWKVLHNELREGFMDCCILLLNVFSSSLPRSILSWDALWTTDSNTLRWYLISGSLSRTFLNMDCSSAPAHWGCTWLPIIS